MLAKGPLGLNKLIHPPLMTPYHYGITELGMPSAKPLPETLPLMAIDWIFTDELWIKPLGTNFIEIKMQ